MLQEIATPMPNFKIGECTSKVPRLRGERRCVVIVLNTGRIKLIRINRRITTDVFWAGGGKANSLLENSREIANCVLEHRQPFALIL